MPNWLMKLLAFLIEKLVLSKVSKWLKGQREDQKSWKKIKGHTKKLKESGRTNEEIIAHLRNLMP